MEEVWVWFVCVRGEMMFALALGLIKCLFIECVSLPERLSADLEAEHPAVCLFSSTLPSPCHITFC